MTPPQTAAGRALLKYGDPEFADTDLAQVLAIETEARAAALDAPEVVALADAARRIRDDHRAGYEPSIGAIGQLFRALAAIDALRERS